MTDSSERNKPPGPAAPPPSAEHPIAPRRPPVAPSVQREQTTPPPPSIGAIASHAPPLAPRWFEDEQDDVASRDPLVGISEHARELMLEVAGCLPIDSSFDFSQRITDHLAAFWQQQQTRLRRGEDGRVEKDYVGALRIAKSILVGSISGGVENLIDESKAIADELDATAIGYYAPTLPPQELRLVQAFHDLALALLFYKVSHHVADEADRHVMLASSMGAQGSLTSALDWFTGFTVPAVIQNYAGLLKFKIEAEKRRR